MGNARSKEIVMKSSFLFCLLFCFLSSFPASADIWTKVNFSGGNVSDLVSFPSNPDIMLACVVEHGIYRSVDRGDTWSRVVNGSWNDLSISDDGVAFLAGDTGVMVSHDAGNTWASCLETAAWKVITFRNGIVAEGVGTYQNYSCPPWRLSRDNGANWQDWEGTENTFSLLFQENGAVYRSAFPSVYRSEPDNWSAFTLVYTTSFSIYDDTLDLRFGFADGDSVLYGYSIYIDHHPVGSQTGGVFRSSDAGATWENFGNISSVSSMERYGNTLIAGTPEGALYAVSLDSANATAIGTLGGEITAIDTRRFDSGELVVATKGGIFKTTDGGLHWRKSDAGIMAAEIASVQAIPAGKNGERIIVSTKESGVFYSDDGGVNWILANPNVQTTPGLLTVSESLPRRIYAAEASIYISKNDGESWERIQQTPAIYYGWYSRAVDIDIDPRNPDRIVFTYDCHSLDDDRGIHYYDGRYSEDIENEWNRWKWEFPFESGEQYKCQFSDEDGLEWVATNRYGTDVKPLLVALNDAGEMVLSIDLPGDSGYYYWYIDGRYCYIFSERDKRLWVSPDLGGTWNFTDLTLHDYTQSHYLFSNGHLGELVMSPDRKTLFLLYPGNGILASSDKGRTWNDFSRGMDTAVVYQLAFSPVNPSTVFAATNDGLYRLDNATGVSQAGESTTEPIPFTLAQNAPNPFNPSTVIGFELNSDMPVRLTLYSATGQTIRELMSGSLRAGRHAVTWDGRDKAGLPVSSGLYFYRLEAGGQVQARRMLLLK